MNYSLNEIDLLINLFDHLYGVLGLYVAAGTRPSLTTREIPRAMPFVVIVSVVDLFFKKVNLP